MTTKEILTEARGFIERGWTQGICARDSDGEPVPAKDPSACEWCVVGAVWAALPEGRIISDYTDLLTGQAPYDVALFNDNEDTTKEDILKVFDEAIARCEDGNLF